MLEGKRIAVVVPAFDEAALIARTLRGIPSWIDRVVVVDDASGDDTAEIARSVGDPRVLVVRHELNRGVGAAIATGYAHAFEDGADVAVVMAGDAQMDPADLPRLLEPVLDGRVGYAKGDRLSWPDARRAMPTTRWLGNVVLSWLTRVATGLAVNDSQCGYTALAADAARRLPLDRLWARYGYPNDLLGMLGLHGVDVADVPVRPVYADERSGVGWRHALFVVPSVLLRAWWRRAASVPRALPARSSRG
ncbi:MAG: glycosyltransferase family 2 protein [Sandaracinus sp.]|nr:glycosyltransferase family 2 protein [Sandaracinus sp.]MCB9614183.1 glycosyltransferase family 2 protein [Sandaracinus sp.]MCB9633767.1 glycosyltransferase family 2 protein [Sandaracinus sp.]